jgi:acetyl esterase/lipase
VAGLKNKFGDLQSIADAIVEREKATAVSEAAKSAPSTNREIVNDSSAQRRASPTNSPSPSQDKDKRTKTLTPSPRLFDIERYSCSRIFYPHNLSTKVYFLLITIFLLLSLAPLIIFSVELTGRWENKFDNFVIRPKEGIEPSAVLHFIGGAFVGAAPHLTYRYLLESLCDSGYIVVATPYALEFDHIKSADTILERFDRIAVELAREYGPLPVVGIGHSAGALLQTLITCLFPGAPRAGNILISFNNKSPTQGGIPGFEDIIIPFSELMLREDVPQITQFRCRIIS